MTAIQEQYVISIMSRDRVGIVFEISTAISELNGDISDIRQSVLCGYFTMILLASFPGRVTQRDIERKLAEVDARSETTIDTVVKKVENTTGLLAGQTSDDIYVLTASGPDRVGFVSTVSSFCMENNINILDLSTTASNGEYVMILMVDMEQCGSIGEVRNKLSTFANETQLNVVLQHHDIFKALSDINLPARM